jgi:serine/threonine-protein kinase
MEITGMRWLRRGVSALVICALLALAVLIGHHLPEPGSDRLTMPGLVGMSRDDAVRSLTDFGLVLAGEQRGYDDTRPEGAIFKTEPEAGAPITRGQAVTIWISDGPRRVQIPEDLVGMELEEAQRVLDELGLQYEELGTWSPFDRPGHVVGVEPEPGSFVRPGTRVTLHFTCWNPYRC